MRFAQQLKNVQGIYSQYVVYKTLKQLINIIEEQQKEESKKEKKTSTVLNREVFAKELWTFESSFEGKVQNIVNRFSDEEINFIRNLEEEIDRVKRIHSSKMQEFSDMLTDVFRRLVGGISLEQIIHDIDRIAIELVALEAFIRQSKTLFYKILKKHDRRTNTKVLAWMLVRLEQENFWNPRFDPIVVGISDAYAEVRALEERRLKGSGAERDFFKSAEDVETFERKTQKFFVRPENIMRVKTIVVRYLPLDIFGRKKILKNGKTSSASAYLENLPSLDDSCVINSVYLDNDQLQMYHERIGGDTPRGNLVRIRWYGSSVNPPSYVFMERKTRQAGTYKVDESVKERFRIKRENVMPYMNGTWSTQKKLENMVLRKQLKEDKAERMKVTSFDIQSEIVTKRLGPAVRTVCRRSAFQQGKDQRLRLSLDTNLHMLDELPAWPNSWYRDMDQPLTKNDIVTFGFGVLEIKTQEEPPQWVMDFQNSGLIIAAEHFSKFLYGSFKLRPLKVRFEPPWLAFTLTLESNPRLPQEVPKVERNTSGNLTPSGTITRSRTGSQSSDINNNNNNNVLTSSKGGTGLVHYIPSPLLADSQNISLALPTARLSADKISKNVGRKSSSGTVTPVDIPKLRDQASNIVANLPNPSLSVSPSTSYTPEPLLPSFMTTTPSRAIPIPESEPESDLSQTKKVRNKYASFLPGMDKEKSEEEQSLLRNDHLAQPRGRRDSTSEGIPLENMNDKSHAREQKRRRSTFGESIRNLFMQWVNTVTFLSLTGITLLNTDTTVGRYTGIMMILITIGFAIYALNRYRQRLKSMQESTTIGFEDRYGPIVLVTIFCLVLIFIGGFFGLTPLISPATSSTIV